MYGAERWVPAFARWGTGGLPCGIVAAPDRQLRSGTSRPPIAIGDLQLRSGTSRDPRPQLPEGMRPYPRRGNLQIAEDAVEALDISDARRRTRRGVGRPVSWVSVPLSRTRRGAAGWL